MTQGETCLLFGCDASTESDIIASMKLIEMDVLRAESIEEAKRAMLEMKPKLVFARCDVSGDSNPAVELSKNVKSHVDLQTTPIVLLHEKDEPGYEKTNIFEASLKLPVEFPTFTQQVRKLIEHFEKHPPEPREIPDEDLASVASHQQQKAEAICEVESSDRERGGSMTPLDKRMVVAYGIQMRLLEVLRSDMRFQNAGLETLPEVVAEVTAEVCREFNVSELIQGE